MTKSATGDPQAAGPDGGLRITRAGAPQQASRPQRAHSQLPEAQQLVRQAEQQQRQRRQQQQQGRAAAAAPAAAAQPQFSFALPRQPSAPQPPAPRQQQQQQRPRRQPGQPAQRQEEAERPDDEQPAQTRNLRRRSTEVEPARADAGPTPDEVRCLVCSVALAVTRSLVQRQRQAVCCLDTEACAANHTLVRAA